MYNYLIRSKIAINRLTFRPWVFAEEYPEGYKPQKRIERLCEVCNTPYLARKTSKKFLRRYCSLGCAENPNKVKQADLRFKTLPIIPMTMAESEEMLFWDLVEVIEVSKYRSIWKQEPGKKAYSNILKKIEELKKQNVFRPSF